MSEVVALPGDHFAAAAEREGATLHVWLQGVVGHGAIDALEVLLAHVHAEAARPEITLAVIDLRRLQVMSYSGLRSLLSWIADIWELEANRRYRVAFLFDPALRWQRRILQALRRFAPDLVSAG
jgi:hypothetical protein